MRHKKKPPSKKILNVIEFAAYLVSEPKEWVTKNVFRRAMTNDEIRYKW